MRALGAIVLKEVRELITPQTLAPMLIVVVLYGFLGRMIRGERAKQSGPEAVLLVDGDSSTLSARVRGLLGENGFVVLDAADTASALAEARRSDVDWLLVLPRGLGDSVAAGRPAAVESYGIVRGFALTQMMKSAKVAGILRLVNNDLVKERIAQAWPGEDAEGLLRPVDVRQHVVLRGRVAPGTPEQLAEVVLSQAFFIPVMLLLLLIMSSQMIASSVGQEKENKTLETLLTVPVNRMSIVLGKMLGAVLFALLASSIVFAALSYYMRSVTGGDGGTGASVIAALGLTQGVGTWLLLGLAMFLALVCALAVVSVLAVFADDARSAQLATMPVMIMVLLPYLVTMFLDLNTAALPLRITVYAIPFSYPFLVQRAALFGDYGLIAFGLCYMTAFAAAMVFLAARLYSSDRILTARLRLRRGPGRSR